MVDVLSILVILGGLVLLFAGAALSVYGVALLGLVLGSALGFVAGPTLGGFLGLDSAIALGVGVAVGAVVGVALAYLVLTVAVAILSFVVGTFIGTVVIAPALVDLPSFVEVLIGLGIGIGAAALAMVLTRTVLIVVTASVGAIAASRSLTVPDLLEAGEEVSLDPLGFEVLSPLLLALFVLGVLTQFGLFKFGYVTALLKRLPGARMITDRR